MRLHTNVYPMQKNEEEKKKIVEEQYLQLKKFIEYNLIDIENTITECIRRWIYVLKEMKKNTIKYENKEDIRGFFLPK